jgi:hypothetical protein
MFEETGQNAILDEVGHCPNILHHLPPEFLSSPFSLISNSLLRQQVHGWLGLSLNFLREHSPASLPSITESAGTPQDSAENAETSEPVIIPADMAPVDVPMMADWELSNFNSDFGVIGGPCTQIPSKTILSLANG